MRVRSTRIHPKSGKLSTKTGRAILRNQQEKDHGEKSKHEKEREEKTAQNDERKKAREKRKEEQEQREYFPAIIGFNQRQEHGKPNHMSEMRQADHQ
jgi:hypothetical protein